MAMPNRAVMMGRPMATTDPKASSMMMMAARMPIPSEPGSGPRHQADGLAAQGHVVPGRAEGLGGRDHLLDGGRGEVTGLLVEDDLHIGDVTVEEIGGHRRRERADHLGHMGQRLQGPDQLGGAGLNGGRTDRTGGGDDHLVRTAGLIRKARSRICCTGCLPPVRLLEKFAARRLGAHVRSDQDHEPEDQDRPAVVVAPPGEAGQAARLGRSGRARLGGTDGWRQGGGGHDPKLIQAVGPSVRRRPARPATASQQGPGRPARAGHPVRGWSGTRRRTRPGSPFRLRPSGPISVSTT